MQAWHEPLGSSLRRTTRAPTSASDWALVSPGLQFVNTTMRDPSRATYALYQPNPNSVSPLSAKLPFEGTLFPQIEQPESFSSPSSLKPMPKLLNFLDS